MQFDYNVARTNLLLGYLKLERGDSETANTLLEACLDFGLKYPDWPAAQQLAKSAGELLKK